jgi:hypothetical protein
MWDVVPRPELLGDALKRDSWSASRVLLIAVELGASLGDPPQD